jgi:hypothetical protein
MRTTNSRRPSRRRGKALLALLAATAALAGGAQALAPASAAALTNQDECQNRVDFGYFEVCLDERNGGGSEGGTVTTPGGPGDPPGEVIVLVGKKPKPAGAEPSPDTDPPPDPRNCWHKPGYLCEPPPEPELIPGFSGKAVPQLIPACDQGDLRYGHLDMARCKREMRDIVRALDLKAHLRAMLISHPFCQDARDVLDGLDLYMRQLARAGLYSKQRWHLLGLDDVAGQALQTWRDGDCSVMNEM